MPVPSADADVSAPARASAADTARVVAGVLAPLLARGIILRRPPVVGLAERVDADRRAVRLLQDLHEHHGAGPLVLGIPGRTVALVLDAADVRRVLDGSPDPFTPATVEKRAALGHFQPHGVLVSEGAERSDRRRFNEAVLETGTPVHHLGERFVTVAREEAAGVIDAARRAGELSWDTFALGWWRLVRRVTFGDHARDEHSLTDLVARLRARANWAYLRPGRADLRAVLDRRVRGHVERAAPGSLAQLVATVPATGTTDPVQQVPQWLFAFDAAAMATFRALALLDAHPEQAARARDEIAGRDLTIPHDLPHLRACVLESVRLWPTTPAILRDTTRDTSWATGTLPAGTALVIHTPFFHRDDRHLREADRFAPWLWPDGRSGPEWPLVPFSAGPAVCAGQDLVLLLGSTLLATLLASARFEVVSPLRLDPHRPLPGTLSPFALRFSVEGAAGMPPVVL